MDFSGLSNDQLVDLARAICIEARARGEATYAAYTETLVSEAEKAKIVREATEKVAAQAKSAEEARIRDEATKAAQVHFGAQAKAAAPAAPKPRNVKLMNGTTSDGAPICTVKSPYSAVFVSRVKKLGATWNQDKGWWRFQPAVKEAVALLCLDTYGERGDEPSMDYVNIDVCFPNGDWESCGPVEFAGRVIARAYGRDSGAKIGDKVAFLKGGATSSGSVKNWNTKVEAGSVVRIIDVPREFAESLAASDPNVKVAA